MERKPIRLSGTSYAVLSLIGFLGEATPYDLKRTMALSIENFWPVPHTTFYAEPARLAAAGYLEERQERHGRRRKLYTLTGAGREALDAWLARPTAAAPEIRDEALLKIFAGADPEALLTERRAWHAETLARLSEEQAAQEYGLGAFPGPARSWVAGIGYHESMLRALDALIELHRSGEADALLAEIAEQSAGGAARGGADAVAPSTRGRDDADVAAPSSGAAPDDPAAG